MKVIEQTVQSELFSMQDKDYREFQCKLMPTVDRETVIGVRTPLLRAYAKRLSRTEATTAFLEILPHKYYEENNLHAFLIEQIGDFEETVAAVDRFLPYINNWATCDSLSPKVFQTHKTALLPHLYRWMASEHPFAVRFGIEGLMRYFLGQDFSEEYPRDVANIQSEDYYVNMMIAWYFATALAFQYERILPYVKERRLSPWIHTKALQKAIESHRLSPIQKQELRLLR